MYIKFDLRIHDTLSFCFAFASLLGFDFLDDKHVVALGCEDSSNY